MYANPSRTGTPELDGLLLSDPGCLKVVWSSGLHWKRQGGGTSHPKRDTKGTSLRNARTREGQGAAQPGLRFGNASSTLQVSGTIPNTFKVY